MNKEFKIICTIGPGSNNPETLEKLGERGVSFFRINLSHTPEDQIAQRIKDLLGYKVPIIIDTEGPQIRSGNTSEIKFKEGQIVRIHGEKVDCNSHELFFTPPGVMKKFEEGDLISIDFDSLLLRILNTSKKDEGFVEASVVIEGNVGGRKAVQVKSPTFKLPAFSKKDQLAIEIAKKYGVKHFTLSFMESPDSVLKVREIYPEAVIYSKIESKKGLDRFLDIARVSEGVLIDRGDLSNQVPLEKMPFIQKYVINKVKEIGKEVFVATNTLELMASSLKPNKAEVNDIINTLLDGATGIALTKETAIGKYPIETVNMISTLMRQVNFVNEERGENIIDKIANSNYLTSEKVPELLIKPHGGKLVKRFNPSYKGQIPEKRIEIDSETLMDVEQIAVGAFSPLEGFLGKADFESVTNNMRLSNGVVWPLPIILAVNNEVRSTINENDEVALTYNGKVYAILHLNEIYSIDKIEAVQKIYGTIDEKHPGVKRFLELGDYFLGGKITLLQKRVSSNKIHELTPEETRKIFAERGWSKVVGFHTRNVIHRSHEFIQLEAMRKGLCDGLFVHPVIGKKKPGDFEAEVIVKTYEEMIEKFYPKSKVVLGTFATYSRYAGPREALFTALCRKNFGCSHFIVGRDHTGVGSFYDPHASHKIFDQFSEEDFGIEPIKFDNVFYSDLEKKHIHEPEFLDHPDEFKLHISGTQVREMLKAGEKPPEWFMRPEVSKIIVDEIEKGGAVFVE